MDRRKILLGMALAAVVLTGCKPTEKNYRAAYDAAVSKREKVNESLAADGLISEDAPRKQMIDGEEFYFAVDGVKAEDETVAQRPVKVAVSVFKMPTNARSGAEALRAKGYQACAGKALGDKWYLIAGSFDSVADAAAFIREFKAKNPKFQYIGMGTPVIIRN